MANDLKLQEGHPVDENLRPIKVGGKSTAIETAQSGDGAKINGDLEISGKIPALDTNELRATGNTYFYSKSGALGAKILFTTIASNLELYDMADEENKSDLITTTDGATIIRTTDNSGSEADFSIDADGDIILDSATGVFILRNNGTEFSVANSAYAGMILGYTKIQNDGTGSTENIIALTTDMTVLQTAHGTNVSIAFVAPPSGNVEIMFSCNMLSSSTTVAFALSDNATFNEVGEIYTYDQGGHKADETDINTIHIPFVVTGLTANTSYTYYIGAEEVSGSSATIYHGRFRATGKHYPPIIVKAIALPATIVTGE